MWDCLPYKSAPTETRFFLRRDDSVECYSPDHDRLVALAVVLTIVWPFGMNALFIAVLTINRRALMAGVDNTWTRATRFLTGGYRPGALCVRKIPTTSSPFTSGTA